MMNKKPAAMSTRRTEDSMGRSAARKQSVKKGATPGEANRAQSVTPGEKRENRNNSLKSMASKPPKPASRKK